MTWTIGSLFSGIGGIELGLERAGMGPVLWQAESDPYCQRVLEKHWPGVRRYADVRDVQETEPVDLICGGFPCQDISLAGAGAGIEGKRSGLWSEFDRCLRLVRPRFAIVENVTALLGRGMGRVQGDLAEGGFDTEWDCIPASAVGAPFEGDRLFICATDSKRCENKGRLNIWPEPKPGAWWLSESGVCRVVDGVSSTVGGGGGNIEVASLANAVVPQVAEYVGRLIMDGGS